MSDLSVWALQLAGIIKARGRIAAELGTDWPKFARQLRDVLGRLDDANQEQLRYLVDQLMRFGLNSSARHIFAEIGRQSREASDRTTRGFESDDETTLGPIRSTPGLPGALPPMTVDDVRELGDLVREELDRDILEAAPKGVWESAPDGGEPPEPQDRPPRYVDFDFYPETAPQTPAPDPVTQGHTLKQHQWYQLEVAIRVTPRGQVPPSEERRPIREPRQKRSVTLYVNVVGPDFEIEEPVQTIELPPQGDSTENAWFRVRPTERTDNARTRAQLQVRIYWEFNLLEAVVISAEVAGPFDDASHSQIGLDQPIEFDHRREVESWDLDFDNILPREMHIDITRDEDAYLLHFVFRNAVNKEIEFTDVPARLTEGDLEDDLLNIRKALWNITMSDPYGDRLEGVKDDFARQMNHLARRGRKLWVKLFKRDRNSSLFDIGQWLEDHPLPPDKMIQVSVAKDAQTFVFPWSLMYDQVPPQDDKKKLPDLDGFWGLRYVIEQRLPGRAVADEVIALDDGFEVGFMLWPFDESKEQTRVVQAFTARWRGTLTKGKPIIGASDAYDSLLDCHSQLLYYFTHGHTRRRAADIGGLDFVQIYEALPEDSPIRKRPFWKELYDAVKGEDFESDSSWIKLRYGKLGLDQLYEGDVRLHNHPIVFLNMCESAQATPSLSDSFIHFFINRGARSVIATECTMRPLFAHHFSQRFFEALSRGDSVGQAILDARRAFIGMENPIGLAYSLFGSAGTRFDVT